MYGGIAESGLGLAQNIVGQMINESDYAKKGSAHFVCGALKALTAKGIQKLANKKIDIINSKPSKAHILKQKRINGKVAEEIAAKKLEEKGLEIVGSQVSAQTSAGRRTIDHLIRDKSGSLVAIEVKYGNAF